MCVFMYVYVCLGAISESRSIGDIMWLGGALEGYVATILLIIYLGNNLII